MVPIKEGRQNSFIDDPELITAASQARFQRVTIALLSMITVVFNTPVPGVFLIICSSIAILFSLKAEPVGLFYRNAIRKLKHGDIFSFKYIFPGSFLLDPETDRFIHFVYITFLSIGMGLYLMGSVVWVIPIAIVAAGSTLSASTGICLMAFIYALVKEWKQKRNANFGSV